MNKLLLGKAEERLKEFDDNIIDLTVTSPPYDNLRNYNGYSFDFETIAKELFRVTRNGGVVVWVVNDKTENGSETGTSFKQALYFKECGFNLHDTMIYEKNGIAMPDAYRYYNHFEYMFIFSKGKPKTFNPIQDRKNSQSGTIKTHRNFKTSDGIKNRKHEEVLPIKEYGSRWNIWRYEIGWKKSTSDEIAFEHPAIFPEKLAQDHIISWSNKGDLVLDPFCGSGTTLKMAKLLERNYIGIDISEDYLNIAKQRIPITISQFTTTDYLK